MSTTETVFRESRPQFFANRLLRLAIKTALAQELGTDCLSLLCVVAMTEDARRYRGPVTFWNSQLLPLVGFSKWERLDKARKAAVGAGWLAYAPGGRHQPGRYRVTIPAELQEVEDAAVDESRYPAEGYQTGDQQSPGLPQTDNDTEAEAGIDKESKRGTSRVSTGVTSLPVPTPDPLPVPKAAGAAGVSTKSRKKSAKRQEPVQIPESLDTDAARKALDEFREHRRQMKKPLTALAEKKLLQEWSSKGSDRFVAAVDHSIARGWQGVFERTGDDVRNGKASPGLMDSLNRFVAAEGES
jgi:hypothetical protein